MIADKQLALSDAQVLAATGNSTNVIDNVVPLNLGSSELRAYLNIRAKSGTGPSIRAQLVGADDSGFSTNKITVADTGVLADPALGLYDVPIRQHAKKRYYRTEYTLAGTTPNFTVDFGFVESIQTNMANLT
jgi:hypothetical protein